MKRKAGKRTMVVRKRIKEKIRSRKTKQRMKEERCVKNKKEHKETQKTNSSRTLITYGGCL